jgi:hypothetical protein
MNRYTVFLDTFEEHAEDVGLTADMAFDLILERTGYSHEWERRDDAFWLVLHRRQAMSCPENWPTHVAWGEPLEFASTLKSDASAREELRELVFSGILKSWRALPDDAFIALRQSVLAKMEADMREYEAHEQKMEERMRMAGASYLRLVG